MKWIEEGEIINYKIKINHAHGSLAFIGIASCDDIVDKNIFYLNSRNDYYYGFKNKDTVLFYNDKAEKYGEQYLTGDIIEMCVDLQNYRLSYKRNNKYLGIAVPNLYITRYKLAITLVYVDDEMTIMVLY